MWRGLCKIIAGQHCPNPPLAKGDLRPPRFSRRRNYPALLHEGKGQPPLAELAFPVILGREGARTTPREPHKGAGVSLANYLRDAALALLAAPHPPGNVGGRFAGGAELDQLGPEAGQLAV